MRQTYVQKTVRNARNKYAKKQCDMRSEFRGVFGIEIWRIFSVFFSEKFAENCIAIFYIFLAFS